jgi:D-arabinose 1-dehydrogenase-like Zn-dependent alcohol dehydrogenase
MKAVPLTERPDLRGHPTFLNLRTVREPAPGEGEILVRISTSAVCHTKLDEIEGCGSRMNGSPSPHGFDRMACLGEKESASLCSPPR